jgi:hypothetical protein
MGEIVEVVAFLASKGASHLGSPAFPVLVVG